MTYHDDSKTIIDFYHRVDEAGRLEVAAGKLEYIRTLELLDRFLPDPPSVILDVGGAAGAYSFRLAERGYTVHLIDPVPGHIEQALARKRSIDPEPDVECRVGDARDLKAPDASADGILFFGPLYHLRERRDRITSLKEAHRVLKPGGPILAVGISRFASLFDGFFHGYIDDPPFTRIVEEDLKTGCHSNPTNNPIYWTDAYFHHPDELRDEIVDAGFMFNRIVAVDGFGWMLPDFEARWKDPARRDQLLKFLCSTEKEPAIIGLSAHMMGIGWKK